MWSCLMVILLVHAFPILHRLIKSCWYDHQIQIWHETVIGCLAIQHEDAPLSTPRGDTSDCSWLLNKIGEDVKVRIDIAFSSRVYILLISWSMRQIIRSGI